MELRNNVRTLRKKKDISLIELAEKADVGKSTISDIERGTHIPGIDVVLKIAYALEASVDDLFWLDRQRNGRNRR